MSRAWWSAVAVVAVVLAAVGIAQTAAGRAVLRAAGLAADPPGYTSLSFASPSQLPSQLYSRNALLSAPFVIRNSAPAPHRYRWQILERRNGRRRALLTGQTAVAGGGSTTVQWQVFTACAGGRLQIEVALTSPRESIAFWATCLSSHGAAS
jgi:hypothetical protein